MRQQIEPHPVIEAGAVGCRGSASVVNDMHSQLNQTLVDRVVPLDSLDALLRTLRRARQEGQAVSAAGGRHAMGGQQFCAGAVLLDTTGLNRVLHLNPRTGIVEVEAGIQWPQLVDHLVWDQAEGPCQWGIAQKQTGADRFSLGGSLAANIHGRGLRMKPIIDDVESFVLVDAEGVVRRCSRSEHSELFELAIGGYGLFGVIATVRLRLTRRRKVERRVELRDVRGLMAAFDRRIGEGFEYGDFQFAIDSTSNDFLRGGIFSCYRPVADDTPIPEDQKVLTLDDWTRLLYLAHRDKSAAFRHYASHYLATDGQVYWSDTHQLSEYIDDYHAALDRVSAACHRASEMITEVYVPREAFECFFDDVRKDFRAHDVDLIYGTVRLIERDEESFLAWAREPWACVVFNLHVVHTPAGLERARRDFRRLIDIAIRFGGSYYLTYHRWARRDQVEQCYPQFETFLDRKRRYDPEDRFQSDWYRHYRWLFGARR